MFLFTNSILKTLLFSIILFIILEVSEFPVTLFLFILILICKYKIIMIFQMKKKECHCPTVNLLNGKINLVTCICYKYSCIFGNINCIISYVYTTELTLKNKRSTIKCVCKKYNYYYNCFSDRKIQEGWNKMDFGMSLNVDGSCLVR